MVNVDDIGPQPIGSKISAIHLCILLMIMGVLSIATALAGVGIAGVIFGAVGLVLGGYTMGKARHIGPEKRNLFLALCAVGLILSVVGFLLGYADVVEGL